MARKIDDCTAMRDNFTVSVWWQVIYLKLRFSCQKIFYYYVTLLFSIKIAFSFLIKDFFSIFHVRASLSFFVINDCHSIGILERTLKTKHSCTTAYNYVSNHSLWIMVMLYALQYIASTSRQYVTWTSLETRFSN